MLKREEKKQREKIEKILNGFGIFRVLIYAANCFGILNEKLRGMKNWKKMKRVGRGGDELWIIEKQVEGWTRKGLWNEILQFLLLSICCRVSSAQNQEFLLNPSHFLQ